MGVGVGVAVAVGVAVTVGVVEVGTKFVVPVLELVELVPVEFVELEKFPAVEGVTAESPRD